MGMLNYVFGIEEEKAARISKTEMLGKDRAVLNGQILVTYKDPYTWLWGIRYEDGGMKYAGPYKTRKEAREALVQAVQP